MGARGSLKFTKESRSVQFHGSATIEGNAKKG